MSYIESGLEKKIGDYILNEQIIDGSLSKIYQATHLPTGEKVAIKVLNKAQLNSNLNKYNKAQKEILILKKMFHKNIIKLYEILETIERIYLVMEYCEGGDLYNYIITRGHLTERQSCRFFHDIIEALTYLHSQNIAHRDIKPENFLLDTTGKAISIKLIDFGISCNYNDNELLQTSCGTSAFAAPEIFKGKKYDGLLCDIWSAGIVLYAMNFGYLPFSDENEQNNINNIMNGNYEIPEEANEDLRDLLSHLIEINPEKRMSFEQIKSHKWFNIIKDKSIPGIIVNKHKIPIDDRIVSVCEAYGCKKENIIESVSENYYDNNTATYYIILAKFIRERYDSISDLFSQDYLDYINDPKNLLSNCINEENDDNNQNVINKKGINKDNINNEKENINNENDNKKQEIMEDNDVKEESKNEKDNKKENLFYKNAENLSNKNIKDIIPINNINTNNKINNKNEISKSFENIKEIDSNEIKEKKNNNEVNDSTEDFQNNQITESEQNNNLKKGNDLCNNNQKNEVLSSSFSETSPKGNLDDCENKKDQLIENLKDNMNEDNNKLKKEVKPQIKFEITNISICIQSQNKNKSNIKNKMNNDNIAKNIRTNNYPYQKLKNKINLNNSLNNKNNKINGKNSLRNDYSKKIKKNSQNIEKNKNRNSSIFNGKIKNRLLMESKSNHKEIKEKNKKEKDKSSDKIKNLHKSIKSNVSKISINKNDNEVYKPYNSVINKHNLKENDNIYKKKEKYKLIRSKQFNINSIDITNQSHSKLKNKDNSKKILNYSSYIKKWQNTNNSSSKLSKDKSLNIKFYLLLKSISKKKNQNDNSLSFYNSRIDNSPITKKINFNEMALSSAGNDLSFNNNLSKGKQRHYYENKLKLKKKQLFSIYNNNIFDDSYLFNKSSNKIINNKSFDLNISKNINKEYEKNENNLKNKNSYNPKIYKGPIDLKLLLITSKIDELIEELINCLNKNKIHFKREKNNKFKFYCNKDENLFDIEIFSIYNKDIENKKCKNNKLYYFVYISKAKHKILLKTYLDTLNKSFIGKFRI